MDVNPSVPVVENSTQERYKQQFFKTSLCKYFLENSCKKGDQCSHAHSVDELQQKPVLSKTRMCKQILRLGNCTDPECSFAHDIAELVSANAFFRTKMCDFYLNGGCKLGDKCRYAHSPSELNQPVSAAGSPNAPVAGAPVLPPVDFDDSPDTGYPLRKRGSLSSRATMASSTAGASYASFTSFAHFQDASGAAVPATVVPAAVPVVFVYPHQMAMMAAYSPAVSPYPAPPCDPRYVYED